MPDHHVRQFLGIRVAGHHVADVLPLAQHRHAVGQRLHLVHLVGDDDNRLAGVAHVAQDGEELVLLLRGQHGGRLIQNQDISAAIQHLDNFNRLLLRNGHIVNLLVRVDIKAILVADFPNFADGGLHIQLFIQTEDDVFRRREHIHQLKVLMNHADAQMERLLRGGDGHGLAVDVDFALVGVVNSGEHVHQCSFAASILAQQRKNFAAVNIQTHLIIGQHRAKALGHIANADGCGSLFQPAHSFMIANRK